MASMSPTSLLALSDDTLRATGLSYRKIEYAKGLANALVSGQFDFEGLAQLNNEEAIREITQLLGFGRWSAEIYMLFSLGREDILPADNLGIALSIRHLKALDTKPNTKHIFELTEHWSPFRSAGSLFLWRYYHYIKTAQS